MHTLFFLVEVCCFLLWDLPSLITRCFCTLFILLTNNLWALERCTLSALSWQAVNNPESFVKSTFFEEYYYSSFLNSIKIRFSFYYFAACTLGILITQIQVTNRNVLIGYEDYDSVVTCRDRQHRNQRRRRGQHWGRKVISKNWLEWQQCTRRFIFSNFNLKKSNIKQFNGNF